MVDRRARRQVPARLRGLHGHHAPRPGPGARPGRAGDPAEPGGHRRRHRGGAGPAGSRGRRRAARPRHGRHPRRGHYLRRGCPRRHTRGGPGRLRRFLLLRAGVVQDDDGAVGECGEAARPRVGRADPHRPAARARLRGQFDAPGPGRRGVRGAGVLPGGAARVPGGTGARLPRGAHRPARPALLHPPRRRAGGRGGGRAGRSRRPGRPRRSRARRARRGPRRGDRGPA